MNAGQRQVLLVTGLLGSVLCLAAGPNPEASTTARLTAIKVQASDPEKILIDVLTTNSVPYHVFRLEHPKRLVLDMEGTELTGQDRFYAGQGPVVARIRLGQRTDQGSPVVRVVADLREDYSFDIRHTSGGIEEEIWPGATSAAATIRTNAAAVPVAARPATAGRLALPAPGVAAGWDGLLPRLVDLVPIFDAGGETVKDSSPIADASATSTRPDDSAPPSAIFVARPTTQAAEAPPANTVALSASPWSEATPRFVLPAQGVATGWDGLLPKPLGLFATFDAGRGPMESRFPAAGVSLTTPAPDGSTSPSAISAVASAALTRPATAPPGTPGLSATKSVPEVKGAAEPKMTVAAATVPPITSTGQSGRGSFPSAQIREVARKSVQPVATVDLTPSLALERLSSASPPVAPPATPSAKPVSAASAASPVPRGVPAQPPPPRSAAAQGQAAAQPPTYLGPEMCAQPPYTGERNSFNLKDVDLKDFFRLIHEISGLNVVVDSNVSGTVTLALDNVPWDQALHFVLGNNGLACTVEGNVLRIARAQTFTEEVKGVPLVTQIRYLHYATASDVNLNNITGSSGGGGINPPPTIFGVATILKNMGDKVLGPGGTVSADPRDNAIVFSCLPSQVPIIEAVIDKLDQKSKQVSIEARIVLTTSDVVRQIQTSLTNFLRNNSGTVTTGGTTGTGSSAQGVPPTTLPSASTLPAITQSAPGGFGAYAITNQTAKYFLSAAIAAAETKNQAKTISAPTIVTQNNVPSTVSQGTQIPVQTIINNTVTTVYINATLTLGVTPVVSGDGSIFLNIVVQNNSPGPVIAGTNNPEIFTQAATTQVLVPDGGAVVFGGIKITNSTRSVNQVPGLGDVPILGHLFKSTNREDQQNELIFVVTPKILG